MASRQIDLEDDVGSNDDPLDELLKDDVDLDTSVVEVDGGSSDHHDDHRDHRCDDRDDCDDDMADDEGNDGTNDHDISNDVADPYPGMEFPSPEDLLNYIHLYAFVRGFQIRVRSSEKRLVAESTVQNGIIDRNSHIVDYSNCRRLRLACTKAGKFKSKSKNPNRPVMTTATECKWHVNASPKSDGSWKLNLCVLDHNHECKRSDSRFMPNYKYMSVHNKRRIIDNDTTGKVPFDERNCSKARRLSLEDGDFEAMRVHFEMMMASNSNFFFMYDTDTNGTLRNVFWADGRSRAACKDFGDVVSFDTTYLSDRFKMPFVAFIGVNNHGQPILLGCALLSGEAVENFVWLFETWVKCMSGKAPKAILTDQCPSIGKAVGIVFPNTRHRWCIWHVMRNAKKHLCNSPLGKDILRGLRDTLNDTLTVEEFEDCWQDWVDKYGLQNSDWCNDMYAKRHKWVPVYFKDKFWAGMSSTQRSESINFFEGFVNINTTLKQFLEQFGFALAKRVEEEDKETFRSKDKTILLTSDFVFEKVFQQLYTLNKFIELQKEVQELIYVKGAKTHDDEKTCIYEVTVRRPTRRSTHTVKVDRETFEMKCNCKKFEFKGILCCHLLRVFDEEDMDFVPEMYIVDRWRKDLPRKHLTIPVPYYELLQHNNKPTEMVRYEQLQSKFEPISSMAMMNEKMFEETMKTLSELTLKAQSIIGDNDEIVSRCINRIGKVYGRRLQPASNVM